MNLHTEANNPRAVPPYSAFAAIYDKAMGEAVLPSLIDAFSQSHRRFCADLSSIADVGCGTGRFLHYLTRFGGQLVGVGRSANMLRLAERRLAGKQVELIRMDIRKLRLPAPVSTLTCTFDTLNYLTEPGDLAAAFRGFSAALRPGGTLMFDFIPEGANKGAKSGRQRVRIGDIRSEWRVHLDPEGRGSAVAILMRKGVRGETPVIAEMHRQRWHPADEIRQGLSASGFQILDWRPAEPEGSGDWVHVVARLARGPTEPGA
ncbi:class I SAM-dependent DNA methyltransferase [Maliponia aquimaris]|uniref:class I SAM-dependent DNA methyltransferase n=1 Tax=Maliponia aquimaris TaxID=1673631 RepID=UPI001595347B|nr:class I SAM-dependent methyltransferase [Maliponia aquimaris]